MKPTPMFGSLTTVVILVLALAAPFLLSSFMVFQLASVLAYAPAVLGLLVITGLTGQLALGNGAFFAVGAYTTAILVQGYGWPFWATFPVAGALAFVGGILFGIPGLRLSGHFLAVLTLSIAVAAPQVIKHFDGLTGGASGISVFLPELPEWLGIDNTQAAYFVALVVTVLAFVMTRALRLSRVGRALEAIRDNELVASSLGINVAWFKVAAFGYSTLLAGLGGSAFTVSVGFVAPESFTIGLAALLIIALVVGGKKSEWGAVIGSAFIVVLPLYAGSIAPAVAGVCFAVVVILFILLLPEGMVGLPRLVVRGYQRVAGAGKRDGS